MTTTTTLNGSTIENPNRCIETLEEAGEMVVMADGGYEYRFCSATGVRRTWDVAFPPMTLTAAGTIETAWLAGKTADIVFKPPYTATTYTVRSVGQCKYDYLYGKDGFRCTVAIQLAQADP
jgi:hypothetical protein